MRGPDICPSPKSGLQPLIINIGSKLLFLCQHEITWIFRMCRRVENPPKEKLGETPWAAVIHNIVEVFVSIPQRFKFGNGLL